MKHSPQFNHPKDYILSQRDLENSQEFQELLNQLTDIPASASLHPVPISRTGLHNQQIMIFLENMEERKSFVPVLCTINMSVDLTSHRGIHMSRLVDSIFQQAYKQFSTLDDFAADLAQSARERQEAEVGYVEVIGTYFHQRRTPKTNMISHDRLKLISKVTATEQDTKIKTGIQVYNMTACPCTKAYTKYSVVPALQAMGLTIDQINQLLATILTGTHTQRGTTTLLLDKETSAISHGDLYKVMEQSVHLIYDLLKRPDEHDFVTKVLQKPQFTEDVAREVIYTAYHQFKDVLSSQAEIYAESILLDSIHLHDVEAVIQKSMEEIKKEME